MPRGDGYKESKVRTFCCPVAKNAKLPTQGHLIQSQPEDSMQEVPSLAIIAMKFPCLYFMFTNKRKLSH